MEFGRGGEGCRPQYDQVQKYIQQVEQQRQYSMLQAQTQGKKGGGATTKKNSDDDE